MAEKKESNKLTAEEWAVILQVMKSVEAAMQFDDILERYTDSGNIVLSMSTDTFSDLSNATAKLHRQMMNQKWAIS